MLDNFSTQKITWNKADNRVYSPIKANSGDTNGRTLEVQILNGGTIEDLTGKSVNLAWRTKDGAFNGLDVFEAVDATKGMFKIKYTTGMLSNVGMLSASIVIIGTNERIESSSFVIMVERSNVNDASVQSENSFTSLTTALAEVRDIDNKFNNVTAQLAQTPQHSLIIETPKKVKFVAHRGLSAIAPENSLPSFIEAGKAGFWSAECDVHRTSDGVWVVIHDHTVDRTTNGTGQVKNMTLAQIRSLNIDFGSNVGLYPNLQIPTLEEYLNVCKKYGMVPMIEIKSDFLASDYPSFMDVLHKTNFEEKSIIICFDLLILWEIRKLTKKTTVQYIASISETSLTHVKNMGNAQIDPSSGSLTKELVELAHSMGISVNTWTVNSYETARTLMSYGVDMITTDGIIDVKLS